ncbi:MAG: DNA polymerase III subunit alpha [Planctomycetota bacterium]|jgi:DNA polymerase-3 subunit alpha
MSGDFVHLHTHSHYSLLDCTATIDKLVGAAVGAGMKALAVTDHGNMFGAIEFYDKAKKAGLKPIVGYEAYVAPDDRFSRQSRGIGEASFHLTLLATDMTGYKNLLRLASAAYTEGFYYKPRIDKALLAERCEGLVCLSGCLSGEMSHLLNIGERERAVATAAAYRDLMPKGRFYIEIQDHGLEPQRRILPDLVGIARELEVPLAATNDNHYISRDDWEAHDALLCINTGRLVSDTNRLRFQGHEFYFKSGAEMAALFSDYPGAIAGTAEIAEMCNLDIPFGQLHLPRFDPPDGLTPEQYLRQLCEEGFRKLYGEKNGTARERLEKEISLICQMGYAGYFLIVGDFVRFAREHDIPVGPGRGSAAGSIVSYCLGITGIDPLAYDLLFERFLDENRREMPDIDIDFCMDKRDRVIEYVKNRYGDDKVAQIITFGTMAAKGVVRDVGRVLGVPLSEVNRLCALIPSSLGTTLESAFRSESELQRSCKRDPQIDRLFRIARRLEGIARHPSVHAAGVVIADKPLEEYVPLYSSDGERITQYPMDILPKVGLLKIDFLGLRTLTIIRRAVDLIEANHGEHIDADRIPFDDAKTFAMLSEGDSMGVFQFESSGFRDLLRRLKPDKLSDLIACVALYRPGPLGGGMVDDFVQRKHGKAEISYLHPLLEPILADTYGVMAFQEQVMEILKRLGGMPMADALTCMKAISKKKTGVIEQYRETFFAGAEENGIDAKTAEEIFNLITYFGGYGFPRAHSTPYAMLSYQTAYLKANHPVEFFAATCTYEMGDSDKLVLFVKDARDRGIAILPPDVNGSYGDFRPVKAEDGGWVIRYGLAALKGVGTKAAEAIVAGREELGAFKSIFDLAEKADVHSVNKTVLEVLVKSGAMDSFGAARSRMAAVVHDALEAGARAQTDRRAGQSTFFGGMTDVQREAAETALPGIPEWSQLELAQNEKEAVGLSGRSRTFPG